MVRAISLVDDFVVEAFRHDDATVVLTGVESIVEDSSRERTEDVACTEVNPSRLIVSLLGNCCNIIMRKLITFSFPFCSLKVFRKNVVQFHTFIFLMLFYVSGSKNGGCSFNILFSIPGSSPRPSPRSSSLSSPPSCRSS